jgi:hypothetical protein
MPLEQYSLSDLPDVTAIDIISLKDVDAADADRIIENPGNAKCTRAENDVAAQIADRWRSLPVGKIGTCHFPAFGFRFWQSGREVCRASICWACSSIYGHADGHQFSIGFEAYEEISLEFFQELQRIIGNGEDA